MSFGSPVIGYQAWNDALFREVFEIRPEEGQTEVTAVVPSEELLSAALQRVPGHPRIPDPLDSFRRAVRRELATRTLQAHLDDSPTNPKVGDIPPTFGLLCFTCHVVVEADEDWQDETAFWAAFNRAAPGPGHNGTGLAQAWEFVAQWLDARGAREKDHWRALVLPADRPGYAQIGYTLGLSFPPHRDFARLRDALSTCLVDPDEPDVPTVLRALENERSKLSPRFRNRLEHFVERWQSGEGNTWALYHHPVWSAVRRALGQPIASHTSTGGQIGLIAWPYDEDLYPLLCGNAVDAQVLGLESSAAEHRYAPWTQRLRVPSSEAPSDGYAEFRHILEMDDRELRRVGEKLADARARGLFLFGARDDDSGLYDLVSREVPGRLHCAMVDSTRSPEFLARRRETAASCGPTSVPHWYQLLEFEPIGDSDAAEAPASLRRPSIRLTGAIRGFGSQFLGIRPFLPEVIVPGAHRAEARSQSGKSEELENKGDGRWRFTGERYEGTWTVEAHLDPNRPALVRRTISFSLLSNPAAIRELDEKHDLAGFFGECGGDVDPSTGNDPGTREIGLGPAVRPADMSVDLAEFVEEPEIASAEPLYYVGPACGQFSREPRDGFAWRVLHRDGVWRAARVRSRHPIPAPGFGATADDGANRLWRRIMGSAVLPQIEDAHIRADYRKLIKSTPPKTSPVCDVPRCCPLKAKAVLGEDRTEPLASALDSLFTSKRGLQERDLLALFKTALADAGDGVTNPWDLIRVWVEAGFMDPLSRMSWRGRLYYGVSPHLVLGHDGVSAFGTLVGTVTTAARRRVRDVAGGKFRVEEGDAFGPLGPRLLRIFAPTVDDLTEFGRRFELGLAEPRAIGLATRWIADARRIAEQGEASISSRPQLPSRSWFDWQTGRFDRSGSDEPVRIEWTYLPRLPEVFVVYEGAQPRFWSYARSWAILEGYRRSQRTAIEVREDGLLVTGPALRLPLTVARLAAIASGHTPGPKDGGYFYPIPSPTLRSLVVGRLGLSSGA